MRSEWINAVLKGVGRKPTRYLLRWTPPFRFDLLEVMKCEADGGIVTLKSAQSPLGTHAGHKILTPRVYSWWEFLKVQLRLIR